MNKNLYRLVVSECFGFLVPVSEVCVSHANFSGNNRFRGSYATKLLDRLNRAIRMTRLFKQVLKWIGQSIVLSGLFSSFVYAQALPQGAQVTQGNAQISASGSKMVIQQASQLLGVNWQSFNIGAGQSVQFMQPNAQSVAVNKVIGNSRSEIFGNLQANGQVFLLNPNGVLFGSASQVDVGALVASTARDVDQNNLGTWQFSNFGPGNIINQGHIRVKDGGFIVLSSSKQVTNQGSLEAPQGAVALTVGGGVSLALDQDSLLRVKVDGDVVNALVENKGLVLADGGAVYLTSRGKEMLMSSVINQEGIVRARSVYNKNGRIILDGGDDGRVRIAGTLDASGNLSNSGGQVLVGGRSVDLVGAQINVSGAHGGEVLIGGGKQGASIDGLRLADYLLVDKETLIDVASTAAGDGGRVVLWSNQATDFGGVIDGRSLDARWGGNGGFAEVSSKGILNYRGYANLLSLNPNRRAGNLLLDPWDVTISASADTNSSSFTPSGTGSVINVTTLETALGGANVTVTTGSTGAESGNITVSAPITWSANTSLTLNAANNIIVNSAVTATGATATLSLIAGGTGGIAGSGDIGVKGGVTFAVNNGSASGSYTGALTSGTTTINKQGAGILVLSGTSATTGLVTVSGGTLALNNAGLFANRWISINIESGATVDVRVTPSYFPSLYGGGDVTTTTSGSKTLIMFNSGTFLFSGRISNGAGMLGVNAYNGLWTFSGANTFTGSLYVGANFTLTGSFASSISTLNLGAGINFYLNSPSLSVKVLEGPGSLTTSTTGLKQVYVGQSTTGQSNFSGVISDGSGQLAVTKMGTGALVLSGLSTFTGGLTVSEGSMLVNGSLSNSLPVTVASGAAYYLGVNDTIGSLAGGGSVAPSSAVTGTVTLTAGGDNSSTTFSGVLSDNVGTGKLEFTKSGTGTLILSGANTYTGITRVNAGTLKLGNGGTTGSIASSSQILLNAVSTRLEIDRLDSVVLSNLLGADITGSGGVRVSSANSVTVNRAITLTGSNSEISLLAGAATLAGVTAGGDVALSSVVTTTSGGTLTIFSGNANTATYLSNMQGATGTIYKTYNSSAPNSSVSGSKNFYYRVAPVLGGAGSFTAQSKVYDGTTLATIDASGVTLTSQSGAIDGDTVALSLPEFFLIKM